jgi:hypothetical protein
MPLQIRRGNTAERISFTPLVGEIIYDSDTKTVYIGDGTTQGGIAATTVSDNTIKNIAATLFINNSHTGISFTYDEASKEVSAVVDLSAFDGPIVADALKGSVFADDSTILVDGTNGRIVGPVFANVTGNVVGNLAGNVVGNVVGSVVGDVTGSMFAEDSGILVDAISKKFYGDLNGSVFSDDSAMLVDSTNGVIVGPINSRLAGNLIVTDYSIVTESNGDINLSPNGSGLIRLNRKTKLGGDLDVTGFSITGEVDRNINVVALGLGQINLSSNTSIQGSLTVTENFNIVIESYRKGPGLGVVFSQYHETPDAVNFAIYRARGTSDVPEIVQINDKIADLTFAGFDGATGRTGAAISAIVVGAPSVGVMPTSIRFQTDDGAGISTRAELSSNGIWKINNIEGYSTNLTVIGDLTGSVFADDSTIIIDGTEGGKITSPSVTLSAFLKLPVYADDTARTAGIPLPEKGMVIFITSGTTPAATNQMQVFDGTNWVNV